MNFTQRNDLCNALVRRGFKETQSSPRGGWRYNTRPDDGGLVLDFNAEGKFTLIGFDGLNESGTATEPKDILDIIDREAAKL